MTNLTSLDNTQLMSDIKNIVAAERNLTARFLAHLLEVSGRGLHLELGFQNLFEFCQSLGLSESCSYKRITAMGVVKRFPVAWTFIEEGSLHLSHLCQLASVLTDENHLELFKQATGQSKRAVEKLIAGLRAPLEVKPRCSLKMLRQGASVLPVVVSQAAVSQTSPSQSSLFEPTEGLLSFENEGETATTTLTSTMPTSTPTQTSSLLPSAATPVAELRLTCSEEFLSLLERAKNLTNTPDAGTEKLMVRVLREFVMRHAPEEKEKRGAERQKKKNRDLNKVESAETKHAAPKPNSDGRRFIPAAVKRRVTLAANSRCSFVSRSGRRCSAMRFLQIDHAKPIGLGGTSEPGNLRLLCRSHNLHKAKKDFGKEFIESFYAATP